MRRCKVSSMLCKITKEHTNGDTTFLVRMYHSVADIGVRASVDAWECHQLIVDTDTLNYLNYLAELENVHEEAAKLAEMDKIAEVF